MVQWPMPKPVFKLVFGRSHDPVWYERYINHKDVVDQCITDGQDNILPIVMTFGKNPQELRHLFGKSSWKLLANSAVSRNKIIVEFVQRYSSAGVVTDNKSLAIMGLLPHLSTTVLQAITGLPHYTPNMCNVVQWIVYNEHKFKTRKLFAAFLTAHWNTLIDCARMIGTINPKWSASRLMEEHNKAAKKIAMEKYSSSVFPWLSLAPTAFHHEGYHVTLLNNPLRIATEGLEKRHCVASYINHVERGRYAVFNISGNGADATLGIQRIGNEWILNQCHSFGNGPHGIPEGTFRVIVKMAIDFIAPFATPFTIESFASDWFEVDF